jgi:serine/threonine-protein kinase RsbW
MSNPAAPNEARVVVRRSELIAPVLGRVVGMLTARAQAPIDRLDEVLLLTDAVAAHGLGHVDDAQGLGVHVSATETALILAVGPLRADGASGLLRAADLPGVGNILERVADDVSVEADGDGRERLVLRVSLTG